MGTGVCRAPLPEVREVCVNVGQPSAMAREVAMEAKRLQKRVAP